jgi:hypothetical protein
MKHRRPLMLLGFLDSPSRSGTKAESGTKAKTVAATSEGLRSGGGEASCG